MQNKNREPGLSFYFAAATNAEGEAQFKNLPAGNYELLVLPYSLDTNRFDRRGEVALSPGETKQMQIGGQGNGVRGRLTAPDAEFEIDWVWGTVENGIALQHAMRIAGLVYLGPAKDAENPNEKQLDMKTVSRRPIVTDADGFFGVDELGRVTLKFKKGSGSGWLFQRIRH